MIDKFPFSRREFLKMMGISLGGIALYPRLSNPQKMVFPDSPHIARVCEPFINVRALPDVNSALVANYYEDDVVPWLREVVGSNPYNDVQRWVETPQGYVWSPLLQPVKNEPNTPLLNFSENDQNSGMWVEVTVPWVDIILENSIPNEYWTGKRLSEGKPLRLYYSQIIWVDQIKTDEQGQVWYRLNERRDLDVFWGRAEAFRPLTEEELSPISPEIENKRIDVNINRQSVSCFEDEREVFYCRASTGNPAIAEMLGEDGVETATPLGLYRQVWRKSISAHMGGGDERGGWDTPAIGYATYFVGNGVAFHSTFWHNGYGEKWSHGCVNVRPQDAKWIFRWTTPNVNYDPGDLTVTDFSGTHVRVLEY